MSMHAGQLEKAGIYLDEADTLMQQTGERFWEAELYRLRGERLRSQDEDGQAAVAWFQRALDTARHQQARSLELRAATRLSRLWQRQGRHKEARQLLTSVYDWFTEGFATQDLQAARALLASL